MRKMKINNMEHKSNSSGMGGGFMLGLLLGILLTLLVTTKKGREILRELMDRVIKKVSDIDESIDKTKKQKNDDGENDYVKPKPEEVKKEIRYIAAESYPEKPRTSKKTKEKTSVKQVNEKGGRQVKVNKRLFFRRAQIKV